MMNFGSMICRHRRARGSSGGTGYSWFQSEMRSGVAEGILTIANLLLAYDRRAVRTIVTTILTHLPRIIYEYDIIVGSIIAKRI
jgi:hypothetical protein